MDPAFPTRHAVGLRRKGYALSSSSVQLGRWVRVRNVTCRSVASSSTPLRCAPIRFVATPSDRCRSVADGAREAFKRHGHAHWLRRNSFITGGGAMCGSVPAPRLRWADCRMPERVTTQAPSRVADKTAAGAAVDHQGLLLDHQLKH